MSELNYKDFLKKHNMVDSFDSFAVWNHQQAKIDALQKRIDDVEAECKDWHRLSGSGLAVRILEVLRGEHE